MTRWIVALAVAVLTLASLAVMAGSSGGVVSRQGSIVSEHARVDNGWPGCCVP